MLQRIRENREHNSYFNLFIAHTTIRNYRHIRYYPMKVKENERKRYLIQPIASDKSKKMTEIYPISMVHT